MMSRGTQCHVNGRQCRGFISIAAHAPARQLALAPALVAIGVDAGGYPLACGSWHSAGRPELAHLDPERSGTHGLRVRPMACLQLHLPRRRSLPIASDDDEILVGGTALFEVIDALPVVLRVAVRAGAVLLARHTTGSSTIRTPVSRLRGRPIVHAGHREVLLFGRTVTAAVVAQNNRTLSTTQCARGGGAAAARA